MYICFLSFVHSGHHHWRSASLPVIHMDPELSRRAALVLGDIEVLHTEGHPGNSMLTLPCLLSFLLL